MAGARRVSDRAGRAAMLLISQSARVLANHRSTGLVASPRLAWIDSQSNRQSWQLSGRSWPRIDLIGNPVFDLIAVSRLIVLGVVLREGSQELTLKCLGVLGEHTVNTPGTMFLSLESRALA